MSTSSLKEFANPVPVCQPNLELASLLELFSSSGCDAIVVVNQEQRPLGVVNLRRVMPYLFSVTGLVKNSLSTAKVDFPKPLAQIHPPIIEPVTILSAQLSLNQFCTYLGQWGDAETRRRGDAGTRGRGDAGTRRRGDAGNKGDISHSQTTNNQQPKTNNQQPTTKNQQPTTNNHSQQWVLVDEDGKFLGLLNNSLLLKSLAPNFTANDAVSAAHRRQPRGLNVLVQLLEQLPLPLSIQTSTGQVVAQNSSWRQQIGTSPDLDWVKYTSTLGLNVPELDADKLQQPCQLPNYSSASEVATALFSEAIERVALMSTLAVETHPSEASQNLAKQRYSLKAKASDCSCRSDVPYQGRLLAPPVLTTNGQHAYEALETEGSSIDSGAKLPESKGEDIPTLAETSVSPKVDKSQSSCFSFVRTPLSPSVVSLQDWVRVEEEVQERALQRGERKNGWGKESADAETRGRGDGSNGNPTQNFVHPLQSEHLVKKAGYNLGEESSPNLGTNRQPRHSYTKSSSPSSTLWLVLA
ncbi:MAG: CBS domain-containing protein, partial [Symploca sp. SIO3E6]|nr:CBS domain-containing protein [Caldora sp. SIO3E6]